MFRGNLIRSGGNAKTVKGDGEYETAIMYLAPANSVEGVNLCSMAVLAGCIKGCLFTAGRAATFSSINKARANKTIRYRDNRNQFMADLVKDVEAFVRYCQRKGVMPAVRLNGTSDIQWEIGHAVRRGDRDFASIFEAFPDVQFYDYTKITKRAYRRLPANYSLTLSYSAASERYAAMVAEAAADTGINVAVVFRDKATRDRYMAKGFQWREVIDGDRDDMRFLDPKGVVVGLYAKGRAKADTSGFVVS
jgi:hypothetical protein